MAQLVLRNLDDHLVQALRRRHIIGASRKSTDKYSERRSEATNGRSFAEKLAAMPDVGKDTDYAREHTGGQG